MACGLPLISTQSGGLKEVIGEDAVIIEAGSSKAIAQAAKELFMDKEKQIELSRLGRERMEKEFNCMKAAEGYVDIYTKAIESSKNNL